MKVLRRDLVGPEIAERFNSYTDEHGDELRPHRRTIQTREAAALARAYRGFTLMKLIGDPIGKTVIDIACGEGFYTRMIRQRGAAKVTGVDLSEKMIGLARASEAQQRLGIDYIVGDGRNLGVAANYDLAVAAYFLNYAHDRAELNAMCSGIVLTRVHGL